ncbi:MAG: hypothetical protein ACKORY_06310, partial [Actinomycetota bacterium]
EQLIARQKDLMDNATPSANSTAALAFLRLSALTGDVELAGRARSILRLIARVAPQAPSAFSHAMWAFEFDAAGATEVVIPGHQPGMLREYCSTWRPLAVVAHGAPMEGPLWEGREEGLAYVCSGYVCLAPAATPEELAERLRSSDPR